MTRKDIRKDEEAMAALRLLKRKGYTGAQVENALNILRKIKSDDKDLSAWSPGGVPPRPSQAHQTSILGR